MTQPGGPQVAAVSLDGFDTHANQGAAEGQLANRLAYLDAALDGLASGLGPEWANTVALVGHRVRPHGADQRHQGHRPRHRLDRPGARRRAEARGIIGDWPTLQAARLFENRDTYPALDMRALFKGVLAEQLGLGRRALDTAVFPDSAGVEPVRGIV